MGHWGRFPVPYSIKRSHRVKKQRQRTSNRIKGGVKINKELKETTLAAFNFMKMELEQHLENNGAASFRTSYDVTDFENKKDYRLVLRLREIKR